MRQILPLLAAVLLYGFNGWGQNGAGFQQVSQLRGGGAGGMNLAAISYYNELSKKLPETTDGRQLTASNIEGSMYFTDKFVPGTVYYLDKVFGNFPMRYNAFTDQIEIRKEGSTVLEAMHQSPGLSSQILNTKYTFLSYRNSKGDMEEGYLVPLTLGEKYRLYEKRSKAFKEGQAAKTSFHKTTPHKFVDRQAFYIARDAENPKYFKGSKKELIAFFGADVANTLKSYIKQNRLNLSEQKDMIALVAHANGLEQ
ncbi:hypothetical protein [Spongiimicrobium sp. 2-473A-2-J]|uniref:hypothetical protein n=1 Tax=Eudoraea algarum TaxID=3417568 RepID=UPI003D36B231